MRYFLFLKSNNTANQHLRMTPQAGKKQTGLSVLLTAAMTLTTVGMTGCSTMMADATGASPVGVMPGDRTIAQRLRDSGIEKNARVNLYKLDNRFKNNARVNISSFHDGVLITGQVPDRHLKTLATDNVKAIREVKAVHNELSVGPQASYGDIVQDGVTKAAIRKNLLLLPNFNESRVKVVVERGVVYIMGRLTADEKKRTLDTVQKSDNIVKIVSLIDVIDANGNVIQSPKMATKAASVSQTRATAYVTPVAIDPEAIRPTTQPTPVNVPAVASAKNMAGTGQVKQVANNVKKPVAPATQVNTVRARVVDNATQRAQDKQLATEKKVTVITRELNGQ